MLAITLLLAFLFDLLVVLAARALIRRSARGRRGASAVARAFAFGGSGLAIALSAVIASLATATVQADIIMVGMARYEPFHTIIETDPVETKRLRAAVDRALDKPGAIRDKVKASVEDEVQPYLRERVAHAPDDLTVAMARLTLSSLVRARAAGAAACASVMAGDPAAAARYGDQAAEQALLARIVAARYVDDPVKATPEAVATASMAQTSTGTSGPADPCVATIQVTGRIVGLPATQAAPLLRAIGQGLNGGAAPESRP